MSERVLRGGANALGPVLDEREVVPASFLDAQRSATRVLFSSLAGMVALDIANEMA